MLDKLWEDDSRPAAHNNSTGSATAMDDAAVAALLAQADADFNAFDYGFFNDSNTTAAADGLLGELEVEGDNLQGEDDEDDAMLDKLLEDDSRPAAHNNSSHNALAMDEAAVAAPLAQAQAPADADFNEFGYGFFNDPNTTADALLGELEVGGDSLEDVCEEDWEGNGALEEWEALE
jgi:hypothetical protein